MHICGDWFLCYPNTALSLFLHIRYKPSLHQKLGFFAGLFYY